MTSHYQLKLPANIQAGSQTTYKQLGVAFMAGSTIHGVPHSMQARGRCKTIFWVICLVCGISAFTVNLTLLVNKYTQFLPLTRVTIYNNRTLPFPAVTICNTNPIKSSAVFQDDRLVALLESWGVLEDIANNTTQKKQNTDGGETYKPVSHHIYKRSTDGVSSDGYNTYENTSCLGQDLVPSVSLDVAGCEALCDVTMGCIAFTYADDTSLCAIKAQCEILSQETGVNTYIKAVPSRDYHAYPQSDCALNNLTTAGVTSAAHCSRLCDEIVSCVAVVYVATGQMCYVKDICNTTQLTPVTTAGETTVYIKTGREGNCSIPRARIACPGSHDGIDESGCMNISVDCCFDASQDGVPHCFVDTLKDLSHSHIHTVFRAAQKAPQSPALYDLWVGDTFVPDLETEVTANYFSVSDSETESYKSAILECGSANSVTQVYVSVFSQGEEQMNFDFTTSAQQTKLDWFNSTNLHDSSYADATANTSYSYFSLHGNMMGNSSRRWLVEESEGGCDNDRGWFAVLDVNHEAACSLEASASYPVFMYSTQNTADSMTNFAFGETFFTKVQLDDSQIGGSCVSSCLYMPDGYYQSCIACNVYVECSDESLIYHSCRSSHGFDSNTHQCEKDSSTCLGVRAQDSCLPNECLKNPCYNSGQCNMTDNGWDCSCVSGYKGGACQKCARSVVDNHLSASSQIVLDWSVESEGIVYADGIFVDTTRSLSVVTNTLIPCSTLLLGFSLTGENETRGFLGSYLNQWATGKDPMKCTSDATVALTDQWKLYAYNDTDWPEAVTLGKHGDSPWDVYYEDINNRAKWVWTEDAASQIYCRLYLCSDADELLLMADNDVVVYADGIPIHQASYSAIPATVYIPCDIAQLAFKVTKGPDATSDDKGLLVNSMTLVSGQSSGLICSTNTSVEDTHLWKHIGFDTSKWESPVVFSHTQAPSSEFGEAQWVWTNDNQADTMYCVFPLDESSTSTTSTTAEQTTVLSSVTSSPGIMTTSIPVEPTTSAAFHSIHPERNTDPPTEEFLREEDIITILADTDAGMRRDLGYTLHDMIMECNYDGHTCNESDFSWFFDAVYGNCYVFNSGWEGTPYTTEYEAKQQGDRHGLTVVLDIGQYEYIPDVGEAAGAVVVVHNPDDMPFPADEGILAVPGRLTYVGIRKIDIQRLPDPHGDCVENTARNRSRSLFEGLYAVEYSVNSCFKTCYQKYVVETCGCGDPQYPIEGKVFGGRKVVPCNARNITQDDCKYGVTQLYIQDKLDCDCFNPCHQNTYEYEVSSSDWPPQVQEHAIFHDLRAKLDAQGTGVLTDSQMKRNLVKIQVFYETLSYERLLEYPSYKLAKLFWDIGGSLGLLLGCSALSIIELLELAMDSIFLFFYKIMRKPKPQTLKRNNKVFNRSSSKYAVFTSSSEEDLSKTGTVKRRNKQTRKNKESMRNLEIKLNRVHEESDTQMKSLNKTEDVNNSRESIMQATPETH